MEEAVCEIVTETFEGFEAIGSEWRSSWDRIQGHIWLGLERRELAKRVMKENVTKNKEGNRRICFRDEFSPQAA